VISVMQVFYAYDSIAYKQLLIIFYRLFLRPARECSRTLAAWPQLGYAPNPSLPPFV
jgi:hypothetical protein